MAVNKVVTSDGVTLIDLSEDTVTSSEHIMSGYVGHLANGESVTGTGTIPVDSELSETSTNPVQNSVITAALSSKADTSDIPTNVSELENDSGYITDAGVTSVNGSAGDVTIPAATVTENGLMTTTQVATLNTVGDVSTLDTTDKTSVVNAINEIVNAEDHVVSGKLVLKIPDEDYDAGVEVTKELNDNYGTIVTMRGYANANDSYSNYKPILRNIGTPQYDYDAATKKYVDDHVVVPSFYLVFLNDDGSVDDYSSTLSYSTILSNLSNPLESDYLDIFWGDARFYARSVETMNVNNGDIKFIGEFEYDGEQRYMVFTLDNQNVLTTSNIVTFEDSANKVGSIANYSTSTVKYPTTKAVFDEFQRKPVTVWEVDGVNVTEGLVALQADMSANPSWQLTNLDLSPYNRIKIYTIAAQDSESSTTPSIVLEMSLDPRAAIAAYGSHYVASIIIQKSNNSNRFASLCCAVSADKTSFAVMRMTSLYGTAATSNNGVGAYVFKIEGYYD